MAGEGAPEGTSLRSVIAHALRIAVSVALLSWLLWSMDVSRLWAILAEAQVWLVGATVLSLIAERFLAAYRWFALIRLADRAIAFGQVLRITFVASFVGAFFPGGVGIEALRVYGMARHTADTDLALSSVLMERLLGFASLFAMVGLGLVLVPLPVPPQLVWLLSASVAVFVVALVLLFHPRFRALLRSGGSGALAGPLFARIRRLVAVLDACRGGTSALLRNYALAFAHQALRIASFLIAAYALGIAIDPLVLVGAVPITIFVALLPISIGGFGPREATFVAILRQTGVSAEGAFVLVALRELCNMVAALPGAALYLRGWESRRLEGDGRQAT